MTEQKPNINPGFLTKHKLNLTRVEHANTEEMLAEIEGQAWIDNVWLSPDKQTLKIAYEASIHSIDELIAIIENHGASIKDNWWGRLKLSWQRQTDENIGNNAKHQPHCCNKVPLPYENTNQTKK